jgi:hypothetical protein
MRFARLATLLVVSAAMPLAAQDTAFNSLQQRGKQAMGVDQFTSTHKFDALPTGGRIELQADAGDSVSVAKIRAHMREIAVAFKSGEFSTPANRAVIAYEARDLARGAELVIRTTDAAALEAIQQFMAFQRGEHHAGGMAGMKHTP